MCDLIHFGSLPRGLSREEDASHIQRGIPSLLWSLALSAYILILSHFSDFTNKNTALSRSQKKERCGDGEDTRLYSIIIHQKILPKRT
jgi:hypothetical protein